MLCVQTQQEKPKHKGRRWSFGKLALSEDKEVEKKKDDVQLPRDTSVMSNSKFTMYMYPSQEEWAAVVIQTAFRGYLVGAEYVTEFADQSFVCMLS